MECSVAGFAVEMHPAEHGAKQLKVVCSALSKLVRWTHFVGGWRSVEACLVSCEGREQVEVESASTLTLPQLKYRLCHLGFGYIQCS